MSPPFNERAIGVSSPEVFPWESAILRFVTILLLLTGFALNLRCDPLHEWMGDTDHRVEQDHGSQSHDAAKDQASCRPHCQLMHAMTWPPSPEVHDQPPAATKAAVVFFHENLHTSPYASQLLRPPTALRLS